MRWPLPARSVRPTRRARRISRPRLFESLESRALLSGDILVVNEVPGVANDFHLMRYTQSGTLISSVQIPTAVPNELGPEARGVTVDQNGNIDIYNGTFSPILSSYSPATKTWLPNQTLAGWSTIANVSFGGLAAYKNYVFASDMATAGAGSPQGIVRFDVTGATPPIRFATDIGFTKVSIGQDGMLYGLGGVYPSEITVYNPDTMTQVRNITLQNPANGPDLDIRGIAVDGKGEIFTATWGGYIGKYDPSGNLLAYLHPGGNQSDMTLDSDGQIVTSDSNSVVYLTDTSLSTISSFKTGQWFGFVTFDHFIDVSPPVAPTFSALAAPTVTYGTATTTLGGKISDPGGVPTGSVTVTLNGVSAQAPIDPTTGLFSASFDTSKLGVSSSPYSISYSYPGSSTALSALDTSKSLAVTPRALTVTAGDATKTYGNADPSFSVSYSGFAPGENSSDLTGTLVFTTNEPAGNAPVGKYAITLSGLTSPNYVITFSPGTLTVNPKALIVTANDASKTYGDPDPAFSASYSGFATGDGPGVLSGTLVFTTDEPSGNAPVGKYTITASGLAAANYTIAFAPGTLTVTRRALIATANDASKTYGDPDPAFGVSYTGFAPGEGSGALSGALTFTTNEPSGNAPVGKYTITPGGLTSTNYAITFNPGTLTVNPRSLVVTAGNASKTYGDPDPAFSASYSGFAPGEDGGVLGGALAFATNEPSGNALVGKYAITPSGLSSPNYAITFVAGTLSVTPRALTVTAGDASKTYGQPDPAFTATGSGFAPGDTLSSLGGTPSFTTTEPSPLTAPVGTYAITPSGLTSPNYTITFVPGTLTVKQAATAFAGLPSPIVPVGAPSVSLSARLQSNSVLPAGQPVTVTVLGSGGPLAAGSGVIRSDGTFTAVVNTALLPIGTYTVRYSYAGDHNFTAASATGSLKVTTAYTVEPLYKTNKPHHSGSTIPIRLKVEDASGENVSTPNLPVTAVTLVDANGKKYTPRARGNANAGNAFRYVDHGYLYNLDTTGLAPGRYTLLVSVGSDPVLHAVTFVIGRSDESCATRQR